MTWPARKGPEHLDAVETIARWTRERFRLSASAVVLVSQIACGVPGCPPVETIVAFWVSSEKRYRFRVFKPAAEVTPDDVPPAWYLDALVDDAGLGLSCC